MVVHISTPSSIGVRILRWHTQYYLWRFLYCQISKSQEFQTKIQDFKKGVCEQTFLNSFYVKCVSLVRNNTTL